MSNNILIAALVVVVFGFATMKGCHLADLDHELALAKVEAGCLPEEQAK